MLNAAARSPLVPVTCSSSPSSPPEVYAPHCRSECQSIKPDAQLPLAAISLTACLLGLAGSTTSISAKPLQSVANRSSVWRQSPGSEREEIDRSFGACFALTVLAAVSPPRPSTFSLQAPCARHGSAGADCGATTAHVWTTGAHRPASASFCSAMIYHRHAARQFWRGAQTFLRENSAARRPCHRTGGCFAPFANAVQRCSRSGSPWNPASASLAACLVKLAFSEFRFLHRCRGRRRRSMRRIAAPLGWRAVAIV